jgi:tetratricopeptide (TPR) repeat protein
MRLIPAGVLPYGVGMRVFAPMLLACVCAAVASAHPDTPRLLADVNAQLTKKPGDPDLLMQRGVLYLDEEYANYPQAIADLTAALATPGRLEALLFRATAYHRTADLVRARADLDRYVKSGTTDARAFELRAEVRAAQGDGQGAIADLAVAAEAAPRPELYLRRAQLQTEAGAASAALATLESGLRRVPAPDLAAKIIEAAVAARAFDRALAAVARLEQESARKEPWMLRRAEVLAAAGRVTESQAAYREALAAIESREGAGGFVNQTLRLEKTRALLGLGRDAEARRVFGELGPSARRLPDYDRVAARIQGGS